MRSNSKTTDSENTILMGNLTDSHLLEATVIAIEWERVTVYLDVMVKFSEEADRTKPIKFYAVNGAYVARAVFRQERVIDDIYRLSLNVTNPGNAACIPTGNYSLVVCQDDRILAVAETDAQLAMKLQEHSRNFIYGGKAQRKTYTVTFLVREWTSTLPFVMHILHAKEAGMGNIYGRPRKKNDFCTKLKRNFKKYKKKFAFMLLQKMYNHYRKRYKSNRNTVLFLYEGNYNMASNLKAVVKRIKEREVDKEFTILECAWFRDERSVYNLWERFIMNP